MCHFHAVADHRRCIIRDGKVIWSWIGWTVKRYSIRCRVDCSELEESDEVLVDGAGDDEFVILEVVEERV